MNRFRIALIDSSLQQLLTSLRPSLQIERVDPSVLDSLVGKVDLFLLDDETAIRFLGSRSEETWPSVVVTARDGDRVPAAFQQGIVDDLLVLPPRALDLERIIRGHEMMQALHSLEIGRAHV